LTLLQKFLERFLYFTIYFLEEYKNYVFVSTKSSLHYQESVYCRLSNACQLSTIEFQRVLALSWCPDCPRTNGRSNIIQAFSILFSPSIPNYSTLLSTTWTTPWRSSLCWSWVMTLPIAFIYATRNPFTSDHSRTVLITAPIGIRTLWYTLDNVKRRGSAFFSISLELSFAVNLIVIGNGMWP
jgi:hypothetical protein